VAGVTLHSIQPTTVHGDDCALHVNQIILAQLLANPFCRQTLCHTLPPQIWSFGHLVIWSFIWLIISI
jgi:hypothetical protein